VKELSSRLAEMLSHAPGSAAAEEARARIEHVMLVLMEAGRQARLDGAVEAIGEPRFTHFRSGALTRWSATLPDGRQLELQSVCGDLIRTSNVVYQTAAQAAAPPPLSRKHHLQQRFYDRFTEVGQRVYGAKRRVRVSPDDRLILLVGELEADVNNGGFDQYLLNKGRRRARAALEALRHIGARKTARMLETALRPDVSRDELAALDARFYDVPEDLAVATMRAIASGPPSPRPRSRRASPAARPRGSSARGPSRRRGGRG